MYLSASDGKIEWNEANNIAEYLEMPATPEVVNGVIREQNIYSTEFEKKYPSLFRWLLSAIIYSGIMVKEVNAAQTWR